MTTPIDRRRFLAAALGTGAAAALPACAPWGPSGRGGGPTTTTPPTTTTGPGGGVRRVPGESDFSYVGSFRLPGTVDGSDATFGSGLALRTVGGEPRVLSATVYEQRYFDAAVPSLAMTGPFPVADVRQVWNDVTGPRPVDGGGRGSGVYGLFWDEPTQRLLWSYGDGYNTVSGSDPSIGATELRADGTAVPKGAWRFAGRSCKMTMGGVCDVPAWFADAHVSGRRLAAGFGGYFSIVATGPASLGPAITAFDPAAMLATANEGSVANSVLVGYPFTPAPGPGIDRAHRDADYRTEFDAWNPVGSTGYWSWTDQMAQAGAWVDTGSVSGVLVCPTMGNGRTWYETSTLHAERASHWWFVYDPADLAAVVAGTKQQWEIQPAASFPVEYPGISYPLPGWADSPAQPVTGVAFDAVTGRLFVALRWAWYPGAPASGTLVSVYQLPA